LGHFPWTTPKVSFNLYPLDFRARLAAGSQRKTIPLASRRKRRLTLPRILGRASVGLADGVIDMDFFYIFGGIVALVLVIAIAEPQRFLPAPKDKKFKVGVTYWGHYVDTEAEAPVEQRTIEVTKSSAKEKTCIGHTTYAMGRGVSMRGA
jgi:hypothetical protein